MNIPNILKNKRNGDFIEIEYKENLNNMELRK